MKVSFSSRSARCLQSLQNAEHLNEKPVLEMFVKSYHCFSTGLLPRQSRLVACPSSTVSHLCNQFVLGIYSALQEAVCVLQLPKALGGI